MIERGVPVSTVLHAPADRGPAELAAIVDALADIRARLGDPPVHGVFPGLLVTDPTGWLPATQFTSGEAIDELLVAARRRWAASPHAAAALAWKSYAYWMILPAVLGYATGGRVPLMSAENTLVRLHGVAPFLEIGLRTPAVSVSPGDPLTGRPGVQLTTDLPGQLRTTLLDGHLSPVLEALRARIQLGRRTLLGSVASAVGYALVRAEQTLSQPIAATAHTLLAALGVEDLIELTDTDVRRHTCCLAFTLPTPKVCRGCPITMAPTVRSPYIAS
jgi:ferric iron reductase protein FhuF